MRLDGGRDQSEGDNHLGGILDAHVEQHDVARRNEKQKSGSRIGRCGNKDGAHILLQSLGDFALCFLGEKDEGIDSRARILDDADFLKRHFFRREYRLDDLLESRIDSADDGHARHQAFAKPKHGASDDIRGQCAEQREGDKRKEQADSGKGEGQIVFRMILRGDECVIPGINPLDEPEDEIEGDDDGNGDDESGKKIISQPREDAFFMRLRSRVGYRNVHGMIYTLQADISSYLVQSATTVAPIHSTCDRAISITKILAS